MSMLCILLISAFGASCIAAMIALPKSLGWALPFSILSLVFLENIPQRNMPPHVVDVCAYVYVLPLLVLLSPLWIFIKIVWGWIQCIWVRCAKKDHQRHLYCASSNCSVCLWDRLRSALELSGAYLALYIISFLLVKWGFMHWKLAQMHLMG
jgi:hypothetical protein